VKLAFDTSVLVAALVEPHRFHARAARWVDEVTSGRVAGRCAWHAVAETWSVLTRIPLQPAVSPALAEVAIERLLTWIDPVEVRGEQVREAVRRCSRLGLRSGSVFDALHLVCAESDGADGFVTFNAGDFERLRGDASPPIVVPPDPPSFALPS
jgi:predicted nucleic acid-binding protein